jgi:hypothetical protein
MKVFQQGMTTKSAPKHKNSFLKLRYKKRCKRKKTEIKGVQKRCARIKEKN